MVTPQRLHGLFEIGVRPHGLLQARLQFRCRAAVAGGGARGLLLGLGPAPLLRLDPLLQSRGLTPELLLSRGRPHASLLGCSPLRGQAGLGSGKLRAHGLDLLARLAEVLLGNRLDLAAPSLQLVLRTRELCPHGLGLGAALDGACLERRAGRLCLAQRHAFGTELGRGRLQALGLRGGLAGEGLLGGPEGSLRGGELALQGRRGDLGLRLSCQGTLQFLAALSGLPPRLGQLLAQRLKPFRLPSPPHRLCLLGPGPSFSVLPQQCSRQSLVGSAASSTSSASSRGMRRSAFWASTMQGRRRFF
mmetsp:Transcript_23853/g.80558  ORF Transcript_23853/g.80558 Transcript_23853/m.80558 type:complete len:304 (-) Transcript_23853:954-1865(-)